MSAELCDPFALPEIPPSPEGGLELTVRCRTVRTGPGGRSHPVTINPDWSVTTPHDLELERIAVAMGGYLSCLQLVDSEVPALRELTQLRARRTLPGSAVIAGILGRPEHVLPPSPAWAHRIECRL